MLAAEGSSSSSSSFVLKINYRYVNEHARLHYKETMHAYAMELQTCRVWDYAGDVYVHRLVQNKGDGKLVEFPSKIDSSESDPSSLPDMVFFTFYFCLNVVCRQRWNHCLLNILIY